ncbi:MAG: RluA family pseudouridine synthase [Clostridiales bacterium]|nr:RluA family pseudouridine synthase [Clostridiales bacterium]
MKRDFFYTITKSEEGSTVRSFLKAQGYSKHLIISLKQQPDYLTIGGEMAYVNHTLQSGEILHVKLPPESFDEQILPCEMPLDILYEDDDILVINKNYGVPVHPSHGHQDDTLANGLMWYFSQKNEPFTFRVINRLDRDTTGLLIVAKHALSACVLAGQLIRREIHRTYLAAVKGNLLDTFPDGCGIIDAPIARLDASVIERVVNPDQGESAITHVRLLSYDPQTDTSLVRLNLETGRTHQIRVHMGHIGHPLYGDFLYYPDYRYISRQSLHSWKLEFCHPVTGVPLSFTAPVPPDMQIFVTDSKAIH